MIRIHKPTTAPAKLSKQGKTKAAEHAQDYNANAAEYQSGNKKFKFADSIYNDRTVKAVLIAAQHQKCCFCERLIGNDGDVEHFRPKSAYTQNKKLERPGYYWLAYDWDNLYLCCSPCNSRQKKNLFPIAIPQKRAHLHNNNIHVENPLFIDPGKEEPSEYIGFRGEMPFAVSRSKKGRTTIENLGLDREILNNERLGHLQYMKFLHKIIQIAPTRPSDQEFQELAQDAETKLRSAMADSGEFAAACRSAFANNFKDVIG
jgi:uncharacterized protein (TIGR02646 family)